MATVSDHVMLSRRHEDLAGQPRHVMLSRIYDCPWGLPLSQGQPRLGGTTVRNLGTTRDGRTGIQCRTLSVHFLFFVVNSHTALSTSLYTRLAILLVSYSIAYRIGLFTQTLCTTLRFRTTEYPQGLRLSSCPHPDQDQVSITPL